MNIGLLFGSFDPFHIGHLSMAISALNSKDIDNVWIVPAYQNPWKDVPNVSFDDRYTLILEGCKGLLDKVYPTRIEESLYDIRTYCTFNIINAIKEKYPEHVFSIITSDETISEMKEWKFGKELLKSNVFYVIPRPDKQRHFDPKYGFENLKAYIVKETMDINISSTKVREMLSKHICPVPYISADQYRYIKWNNLYGEKFQY